MKKRYDFTQIETEIQKFWEDEQIYRFDNYTKGEVYSIDTPPPTVSGNLHVGHLFSYTQGEMIARFRRMQGYNVFYPFGFDDNGLPTERLVEREKKIQSHTMPRSEFIKNCQDTVEKYEGDYKALWQSLGISVDWETTYQTISPEVCKISQKLFLDLVEMGKAYTKESPVLWCTECQTSIAQAELEGADVEGTFNYIPFYVDGIPLEVATTRPELLYSCICLFVNPDDERYSQYIGKSALVPLYDYQVPILADDKVDIDKGTGVVMCCTFGDSTDAEWYMEHGLSHRETILPNGKIADNVPFIGNLPVSAAQAEIIRLLDYNGLLCKTESITHTVGIHERCGKPTEIILSRQWYIDILSEKERFLDAANEINWYPSNMKNRYIAWVENLKWDWCISRQRYFGVPFPVWYCESCSKVVFSKVEQLPINPLETKYEGLCECGCSSFVAESAVFDTWATSSVTPQINERLGIKLTPMSMRTHAHEIIRTWTFYTIVRSLYHTGKLPWKDLMICGFVLSKKGEKISKSKNNNPLEPKHLIATHSADVLRYWAAGARLGTDTFFSPDELNISKRFITKLWNAAKFSISHLQDIDLSHTPNLMPVDKWIMERANETTVNAAKLFYEYEICLARNEIDDFFWKDYCDNYIEIVKERLYKPEIHGVEERKSGQYATYNVLLNILKLYAPYVPHITEYIYQVYFRQHEMNPSIHLTQWIKPTKINPDLIEFGAELKDIIANMRKYKSERNMSITAEIDIIEVQTKERFVEWFSQSEKDIRACTKAVEISYIIK